MSNQEVQARIEVANGESLWLVVDHPESNSQENTAHPILRSEVEAIRNACNQWIKEERE